MSLCEDLLVYWGSQSLTVHKVSLTHSHIDKCPQSRYLEIHKVCTKQVLTKSQVVNLLVHKVVMMVHKVILIWYCLPSAYKAVLQEAVLKQHFKACQTWESVSIIITFFYDKTIKLALATSKTCISVKADSGLERA